MSLKSLFSTLSASVLLAGCCQSTCQSTSCSDTNATSQAVINTIMSRRSIRQYVQQPVGRDTVMTIVKCGINAPNGMNKQPWEIRILDNQTVIDSLTAIYRRSDPRAAADTSMRTMFRNARTVVFVAKTGNGELDLGILGENMAIAAWSMGVGSCFLGGPTRFLKTNDEAKVYLDKMGFAEGSELVYCLALGYPAEKPEAKPRDESKVSFVDF